jgi:O-antigen/teichoic acid export membrane protein
VGAGEYGMFFALFNFSILLNIALDFGLTNFNNREISRHSQLLPRYFSNMIVIKLMLAVVYMVISFGFAFIVGYTGRQLWLLAFLVFNQFLSSLILYLRSNISGLQFFKTDSVLSVTDRVLMIGLCSVLLWGPFRQNFHIEWFVYAQTIAYLLTALIAFILVFKRAEFFSPKIDRRFFVSIVKQSYPYAVLVLLMSFYYRIDTVMLERMLPDGNVQSGIYAQSFRLLDAANMIPFLFATLLLPIFSRMIKSAESIESLLKFAFSLLLVISFTFSIASIAYRQQIMNLLYVHHTAESSAILAILMVSFVFISMTYIFGTLLTANGSLRHLNFVSFIGVVVNILLNLILIPRYKVIGAAVASLSTQVLITILQSLIVYRTFRVGIMLNRIVSYAFFIIGAIAITGLISKFFSQWIMGFFISVISMAFLAFIVGAIKGKEIYLLFTEAE